MPSHVLLSRRCAADRHERPIPRRIGLEDEGVPDSGELEAPRELAHLFLTRDGEDDRRGARGEVAGRALSGSVDQIRSEDPEGEVSADDDVVGEEGDERYVSRFSVGRSCTRAYAVGWGRQGLIA